MSAPLLSLDGLTVDFRTDDGDVHAVRGVNLEVNPGEVVAVVGESGSGKSVTALSVLGLHPMHRTTIGGRVWWRGENLLAASPERMRALRGGEVSMIFQDPLTALNPVQKVGRQIVEMIKAHENVSRGDANERAVSLLAQVGIPQPERRAKMYPHEFSGGMRQRAMIAMALACQPGLIIADEPTTALDVTVQAQVLDLLKDRAKQLGAAVLLITHDLGVVAGMADRVIVMYAGLVVESGTVDEIFSAPTHPYTIGLLGSLPRLDESGQGQLVAIGGQPPSMLNPPSGCAFHPRCRWADPAAGCDSVVPAAEVEGHLVACHRAAEVLASSTPATASSTSNGASS